MNCAQYAVKKRKKPVQKIPRAPPLDGAKSNPSKRHRDRLNGELDTLTSLLPFSDEVRARLDKLSVLRLSVAYLKVKSFFNAALKGPSAVSVAPAHSSSKSQATSIDGVSFSEGNLLLQALNGFVLVVTAEGYVFYTSPTIQDFLGFHQSDVIHQSVFELIHTDDRALFRQQLHFALDPTTSANDQNTTEVSEVVTYDPALIPQENSSFLERNFCCRFRCLLDNSSGFTALNFFGRLKYLHGQTQPSQDGSLAPPRLALFSVVTPLQPPSILQIRSKTLLFQSKHKLDFTPLGIDSRGKLVLGYTEMELCSRSSGYHFVHAADMMYCADQHLRMMKTGHTGATIFRLLRKGDTWIWVQSNARLVFKGGKPDFVIARMKALTNEEGEEHLRARRLQLPFNCASGPALLYDLTPCVEPSINQCSAPKVRRTDSSVTPNSILGSLLGQDQSLYCPKRLASLTTPCLSSLQDEALSSHQDEAFRDTSLSSLQDEAFRDTSLNSLQDEAFRDTSLSSLQDEAFRDTHATLTVPGDVWMQSCTLMKTESTVQDMMDTLQQILGDDSLASSLQVEPEELRSWESFLMSMNASGSDLNADLNSVISSDILSIVEEQFQREGGFAFLDHLNESSTTTLELKNQSLQPNYQHCSTRPKVEPLQDLYHHSFGPENTNTNFLRGFNQQSQSQASHTAPPPRLHHLQQGLTIPNAMWNQKQHGTSVVEPFTNGSSSAWPRGQEQRKVFPNGLHAPGLGSRFPGAEEPPHASQDLNQLQQSSCMFSRTRVFQSADPPSALSPSPYCLYQQHQQNSDTLPQPQPFLYNQNNKMSWSSVGNGAFPSPSVPNGATFCSDDR